MFQEEILPEKAIALKYRDRAETPFQDSAL